MIPNRIRIEALVMRMQSDFLETPALNLTLPRAQQRFGVDDTTCEAVLGALVDARVLAKTPEGAYARFFPRLADRASAPARPHESREKRGQIDLVAGHAA